MKNSRELTVSYGSKRSLIYKVNGVNHPTNPDIQLFGVVPEEVHEIKSSKADDCVVIVNEDIKVDMSGEELPLKAGWGTTDKEEARELALAKTDRSLRGLYEEEERKIRALEETQKLIVGLQKAQKFLKTSGFDPSDNLQDITCHIDSNDYDGLKIVSTKEIIKEDCNSVDLDVKEDNNILTSKENNTSTRSRKPAKRPARSKDTKLESKE